MDTPLLLSKRQAAKLLGIGRDTLAELVKAGHLRTVCVLDHEPRIAREECERFAREGTGPVPERLKIPLPKRRLGEEIGSLRSKF